MAKSKYGVLNYAECEAILPPAGAVSRLLTHHTYLSKVGGGYILTLHGNTIATFLPNGDIKLQTSGWRTCTTKSRIRQFTGFHVYRAKGRWMIDGIGPFREGIVIDRHGRVNILATLGITNCPIDCQHPVLAAYWMADCGRSVVAAEIRELVNTYYPSHEYLLAYSQRTEEITVPDFLIEEHGSVVLFTPDTAEAKEKAQHLGLEAWQWVGNSFAIEHRMAYGLIYRLQEECYTFALRSDWFGRTVDTTT